MFSVKSILDFPARACERLSNLSPLPKPSPEFLATKILISDAVVLLQRDQRDKVEDFLRRYGKREFVTQAEFTGFLNPPPRPSEVAETEAAQNNISYWNQTGAGNGHSPVAIGLSAQR